MLSEWWFYGYVVWVVLGFLVFFLGLWCFCDEGCFGNVFFMFNFCEEFDDEWYMKNYGELEVGVLCIGFFCDDI